MRFVGNYINLLDGDGYVIFEDEEGELIAFPSYFIESDMEDAEYDLTEEFEFIEEKDNVYYIQQKDYVFYIPKDYCYILKSLREVMR